MYAFGGGIYHLENHEGTVPGSYSVWVVDLRGNKPDVRLVGKAPELGQLNGVATWDSETIVMADSYYGKVYQMNLITGSTSVCLEDDTLNDPPDAPVRMGVNGIKVRKNGGTKYIYYSSTTRMLLCRVPVDGNIKPTGPFEILAAGYIPESVAAGTMFEVLASATIPEGIVDSHSLPPPTVGLVPDDFCFAKDGSTYVTTHPTNMVIRIPPNGGEGAKIAGGFASWDVAAPTACVFGVTESDRDVLYVVTAGANVVPIDGQTEAAKVLAIRMGP